ncbi:MAG TPA: hypothetical protein DGF36_01605, partial [Alteromonas sp.]|nr:hypothetical protein [Alteromonas sp.]
WPHCHPWSQSATRQKAHTAFEFIMFRRIHTDQEIPARGPAWLAFFEIVRLFGKSRSSRSETGMPTGSGLLAAEDS